MDRRRREAPVAPKSPRAQVTRGEATHTNAAPRSTSRCERESTCKERGLERRGNVEWTQIVRAAPHGRASARRELGAIRKDARKERALGVRDDGERQRTSGALSATE